MGRSEIFPADGLRLFVDSAASTGTGGKKMKKLLAHRTFHYRLLAMLLLGSTLAACDNQVNVGPTEPMFPDLTPTVGALRTLQISGSLASAQGSVSKATILFDGQEINGARSLCPESQGCARLELAGVVSSPAGHHTITFKVLRQSAETDEYLATGTVAVSRPEPLFPDPVVLDLRPTRATLQPGEGVSFEIDLWD